jgi:hypothetical protein
VKKLKMRTTRNVSGRDTVLYDAKLDYKTVVVVIV